MKIVALMLLCLGLGACGQKGPLYLPQPAKPQPETTAPQAEPAKRDAGQSLASSSSSSSSN